MKPAAFLFDLDGTLVDTEALWTKAIVDFVFSRGGKTTYEDILPTVIGRNWLDIDRSLHDRFPEIGESSPMEDAVELRRFYDAYATNPSSMRIDGSIAFFRTVSQIAPCAIVSGSPHDDVVAAAHGIALHLNPNAIIIPFFMLQNSILLSALNCMLALRQHLRHMFDSYCRRLLCRI